MRPLRFAALLVLVGFLAACHAESPPLSGAARDWNLLFVSVDTLRADKVGAYGYDKPTTPFVDSLAAEGARFSTTWAPTPWTFSSTASLMTGSSG